MPVTCITVFPYVVGGGEKWLNRSKHGLSPVFAVLILIAITVIAGVAVYLFTNGSIADLTSGSMAPEDKLEIVHVQGSYTVVQVWVNVLGDNPIELSGFMVQEAESGRVVAIQNPSYTVSGMTQLDYDIKDGIPTSIQLYYGMRYTVTLTTHGGSVFTSQPWTAQ